MHDWCILPHIPNLFIRGKAKNCIFGNGQLKFIMLALRINFSVPPREAQRDFVLRSIRSALFVWRDVVVCVLEGFRQYI